MWIGWLSDCCKGGHQDSHDRSGKVTSSRDSDGRDCDALMPVFKQKAAVGHMISHLDFSPRTGGRIWNQLQVNCLMRQKFSFLAIKLHDITTNMLCCVVGIVFSSRSWRAKATEVQQCIECSGVEDLISYGVDHWASCSCVLEQDTESKTVFLKLSSVCEWKWKVIASFS